ncbi:hypothetical protein QO179_25065 [Bacillus stercoris]|nr:hypothetical protein [Bacillus stercoris]
MKVIIAGGRDFDDYEFMKSKLDHLFKNLNKDKLIIINGDGPGLKDSKTGKIIARGADQLGKKYAQERGLKIELFPPLWGEYGRAAGPIRNSQMAEVANALVAFNTGGRGTQDMINKAKAMSLNIRDIDCRNL